MIVPLGSGAFQGVSIFRADVSFNAQSSANPVNGKALKIAASTKIFAFGRFLFQGSAGEISSVGFIGTGGFVLKAVSMNGDACCLTFLGRMLLSPALVVKKMASFLK